MTTPTTSELYDVAAPTWVDERATGASADVDTPASSG